MQTISGVLFDLDGTLTYTNELIFATFEYVAQKYVKRTFTKQEIVALWGPTEEVGVAQFVEKEALPEAMEDYYRFYRENHRAMAGLYPGIREIFEFLKQRKIVVGLFTGKGSKTTEITLEEVGIKQYFDMVVSGDDVSNHKPSSEGIHRFLRQYSLDPHNVVMVGDAVADVIAATDAGVLIIAAAWDSYAKEQLLQMQVDSVCHTVEELRLWLDERIQS